MGDVRQRHWRGTDGAGGWLAWWWTAGGGERAGSGERGAGAYLAPVHADVLIALPTSRLLPSRLPSIFQNRSVSSAAALTTVVPSGLCGRAASTSGSQVRGRAGGVGRAGGRSGRAADARGARAEPGTRRVRRRRVVPCPVPVPCRSRAGHAAAHLRQVQHSRGVSRELARLDHRGVLPENNLHTAVRPRSLSGRAAVTRQSRGGFAGGRVAVSRRPRGGRVPGCARTRATRPARGHAGSTAARTPASVRRAGHGEVTWPLHGGRTEGAPRGLQRGTAAAGEGNSGALECPRA